MIVQMRLFAERLRWMFPLNPEAVERLVFVRLNGRSGSLTPFGIEAPAGGSTACS